MKRLTLKTASIAFSFAFLAVTTDFFAKSKYERISNGIGNILIGEVLPYNNDDGYKNVVSDSAKLSDMMKWETFYYRAYFGNKISSIKHDARVLVTTIKGIGGNAAKFDEDAGGTTVTWTLQKEDSANYGERSEWSRYFEDFQTKGATLKYYYFPYNPEKPATFEFHTGEEVGNSIDLTPAKMKSWKEQYKLKQLIVIMQVFAFDNLGETTTAENKKVLEAKTDINGNLTFEEKEKIANIKTKIKWGNSKLLAQGKFKIILD